MKDTEKLDRFIPRSSDQQRPSSSIEGSTDNRGSVELAPDVALDDAGRPMCTCTLEHRCAACRDRLVQGRGAWSALPDSPSPRSRAAAQVWARAFTSMEPDLGLRCEVLDAVRYADWYLGTATGQAQIAVVEARLVAGPVITDLADRIGRVLAWAKHPRAS